MKRDNGKSGDAADAIQARNIPAPEIRQETVPFVVEKVHTALTRSRTTVFQGNARVRLPHDL